MLFFRYRILTAIFAALSILYIALNILLPVNKVTLTKYHIDNGQYTALILSIAIPYLIIWFIALLGYARFKTYADTIRKSKDGRAFQTISKGILALALWLPISTIIGSITSGIYSSNASMKPSMVIVNNYLNLVLLWPAFWLVYSGSIKLLAAIRKKEPKLPQRLMLSYIAFAALYSFLVLRDPNRQFATHGAAISAYYTADWITVITIIIPRLIMWFLGMQAVYNIYFYKREVKGPIYIAALNDLANGLTGVIIVLVILRGFESLSSQLDSLGLGTILLIIYLLLVALGAGFIMLAKGAKSLQRIEEI
jgi:hypothetical protein